MKKIIAFLLVISLSVFITGSCQKENVNNSTYSIFTEIADGIYFERLSENKNSIFFGNDIEYYVESENTKYIIRDKLIIRYGYSKSGFVAYHWNELSENLLENKNVRYISNREYSIVKDLFTVYDIENDLYYDFNTQSEFLDFCEKKDLYFKWKYSNGFDFISAFKSNYGDTWEIIKFDSLSLYSFVLKNGEVLYEGYISEISTDDQKYLTFRLQVPDKKVLEFQNLSFEGLNVSFNTVVGKYKTSPFWHEDIYYDKYIRIDTQNDIIQELSVDESNQK